jgi:DNA N-6-adenine-methyltransferase Dam
MKRALCVACDWTGLALFATAGLLVFAASKLMSGSAGRRRLPMPQGRGVMAGFVPDSKSQSWNTPAWILAAARDAFGVSQIALDPCSNASSIVGAAREYRLPKNDGLVDSWDEPTIWVNPPFGTTRMHRDRSHFCDAKAWRFLSKKERAEYRVTNVGHWLYRCDSAGSRAGASQATGSQVIALVPATPETLGWRVSVWKHASGICFPYRRLKFLGPDGKEAKQVIPKPMALIYWSGSASDAGFLRFEKAFARIGAVIPVGQTLERAKRYFDLAA